jgi:hypothetical protein
MSEEPYNCGLIGCCKCGGAQGPRLPPMGARFGADELAKWWDAKVLAEVYAEVYSAAKKPDRA